MIRLNQKGDTLVEVTIALAILGIILIGAYLLTSQAFALGQTAKERTELVMAAQEQAEALINLRDSSGSWTAFTQAISTANVNNSSCATPTSTCFHMDQLAVGSAWIAKPGSVDNADKLNNLPPTTKIWINATPVGTDSYKFQIHYQADPSRGSISNSSDLTLQLTSLESPQ